MDEVHEVVMNLGGLQGEGCAEAVSRTIRELDPDAQVQVDTAHGRINVRTHADTLEVADALNKAGYNATGVGNV